MIPAEDLVIRDVRDADMGAIQSMYAHHMCHGVASWEVSPSKSPK